MKPFHFRLEVLLEFRKMQKEQSQIAFVQATNQLTSEKELMTKLEAQLTDSIASRDMRQQQFLTIEVFKSFRYYFDKISGDIATQSQRIIQADEHRRQCLQALAKAEKDYKIVEKFREKKMQKYQMEAMNEEQKLLDEIGLQIYTREKLGE